MRMSTTAPPPAPKPAPTAAGTRADADADADADAGDVGSIAGVAGGQRVAVVTASTAGIGLAVADALAARGYHVVVSSRDAARVAAAVARLRARHGALGAASGLVCHVGDAESRSRLLAHAMAACTRSFSLRRHNNPSSSSSSSSSPSAAAAAAREKEKEEENADGDGPRVDALVLNAAASTAYGAVLDTTPAQWDKMFGVNVGATFRLVQAAARARLLRAGSAVVVVSSVGGYAPLPGLGAYSVTKTALLALVRVLATELAPAGVRVNGVAPGIIRTRFSRALWARPSGGGGGAQKGRGTGEGSERELEKERKEEAARVMRMGMHIPAGRLGEAEDVAGVVAFLLSDEARYVTGENVVIAGGAQARL